MHSNFQGFIQKINCTLGTMTHRSVRACLILNFERSAFFTREILEFSSIRFIRRNKIVQTGKSKNEI